MPKQYSPFEIRMQSLSSGRYALDVRGLGGDASDTLTLPTDDPSYQALAARLERFDVDEETMVELGQKLFDVLFQGKVKDVYTRSQGMLGPDQRLQLRLNIDATATNVTALPWEFLTDPDQGPLA